MAAIEGDRLSEDITSPRIKPVFIAHIEIKRNGYFWPEEVITDCEGNWWQLTYIGIHRADGVDISGTCRGMEADFMNESDKKTVMEAISRYMAKL